MTGTHNAAVAGLEAAKADAAQPAAPSVNSVVTSKVNNTTNNFNDDLKIRNNEPTIKQAQMMAMVSW
jgi:hypothetical protein